MVADRYGLSLTTNDRAAAAYAAGVDALFAADVGAAEAFGRAIEFDPDFALAHAALAARQAQQARVLVCLVQQAAAAEGHAISRP